MADYFGTYQDFYTESKKDAAQLMGSNNIVGDVFDIDCSLDDEGNHRAWIVSKYGDRIGFFSDDFSRRLSIMDAEGMLMKALLSFVAFTESEEGGYYWGQCGVVCYRAADEDAFAVFIEGISRRLSDGIRPALDFGKEGLSNIISSDGNWSPKQTVPYPDKDKGTAILKRRAGLTDKLVQQGRAKNKGCYIISWVFLLALVALIIFGIKSCVG